MDQALINRIVEAALLAHGQPVSLAQLRELFPDDEPAPNGAIETALAQLGEACATRGVELVEVATGFRYQVSADVHPWVARLTTERQTRYTRATLETLALIAYRQPITRGEIEQVRGVSVSSNTIKALEEREWIRVVGHRDVPGRPALFGTTKVFLDYFGLKRLDELPPLSELKDIGELEPQLQFDGGSGVDARIAAQVAPLATDKTPTKVDAPDADDNSDDEQHDETHDLDFRRERPVVFDDADIDEEMNSEPDAAAGDVHPEAAPGTRVAPENDQESESIVSANTANTALGGQHDIPDPLEDAVETTTVPAMTSASNDAAEPNTND